MPTPQQPVLTYGELLHERERLRVENERLKRRGSNQRRELKRLNAKQLAIVAGARLRESGVEHMVSIAELHAELVKARRRMQVAEAKAARLEAEREYPVVIPPGLAEMQQDERDTFVSEFNGSGGENGKAAE